MRQASPPKLAQPGGLAKDRSLAEDKIDRGRRGMARTGRAERPAGARRADFEGLPAHRTLFRASPHCGLPIGNLTSQFGANVYLDAIESCPRRFPRRRLRSLARLLWNSGLPVAWIDETGSRPGNIAERALVLRWAPTGILPGR